MIATVNGTAVWPQTVAPMSRFLFGSAAVGICQADASKAEGIAFAATRRSPPHSSRAHSSWASESPPAPSRATRVSIARRSLRPACVAPAP